MSSPEIVLVAVMTRHRVIGRDGGMPWHLPADLAHFKAVTSDHPMVMGRRTFEAIGRPLPRRRNLVVSRRAGGFGEGVESFASLETALSACQDAERVMIIGGGQIYEQALARADELALTFIDADIDGDTRFPEFSIADWRLTDMRSRPADEANAHRLVFCTLRRSCY